MKPMTPFKPTPDDYYRSIFDPELTRKIKAYEKDNPLEFQPTPLDLRTIPREEWDDHLWESLAWPPDVQLYLDATKGEPLTISEDNAINERTEAFYGVTEPYVVMIRYDETRDLKIAVIAKE
jgi:hypothetical protein